MTTMTVPLTTLVIPYEISLSPLVLFEGSEARAEKPEIRMLLQYNADLYRSQSAKKPPNGRETLSIYASQIGPLHSQSLDRVSRWQYEVRTWAAESSSQLPFIHQFRFFEGWRYSLCSLHV